MNQKITVAPGDGIGPEITQAVLEVFRATQVPLEYDFIEIGERSYLSGSPSGVPKSAWETIRKNRVILKGPITTPQGGGYKSVNVTLRTALGLFANVRPCRSLTPYVSSHFPHMDLVIVRENEEDLYAGIEYQQTPEVIQTLKLISHPGTEAIVRYAFEYARAHGRKRVTCMTKDNIMKQSDGLFHRIFTDISTEYPDIENDHMIIDIGAARIAAQPERLDVVVTLNLYGDILSDIAAQVAGSVGLAGSANIGRDAAMFEAVHGSAPDIAGQGLANPSGMLLAGVQLLVHLGLGKYAETISNAWLTTIEDGIHTADIFRPGASTKRASTTEFGQAVIERLGKTPQKLAVASYKNASIDVQLSTPPSQKQELIGIDVFVQWSEGSRDPNVLGKLLSTCETSDLKLRMITNRGIKVFPEEIPHPFCTDHWRCRFIGEAPIQFKAALELLEKLNSKEIQVVQTENLFTFDGRPGFSVAQGE